MRPISDAFLLNMAEVSATLIGLFIVGVFFVVESGFRGVEQGRPIVEPYFRAGTRIVLVLFAVPLLLSLALVAMEPVWARVLFVALSVGLVAANVGSVLRVRGVKRATRSLALALNEAVGTAAVLALVTIPWFLGGLRPTREDLTWAILIAFGAGFISIGAVLLSVFDIARGDAEPSDDPPRPPARRAKDGSR